VSSRVPIAHIDIRVSVHATEDLDRVITAIHNVIPLELAEKVDFKKTNTKGHYNNPITLLETRIKEKGVVEAVFERIAMGLTRSDRELLKREIERHLEKRNLFIRLDKQSAYLGEIRLCSMDPIRVKIQFRKSGKEEITKICRRFGMFP
jgi:RNA binding exosome subunit